MPFNIRYTKNHPEKILSLPLRLLVLFMYIAMLIAGVAFTIFISNWMYREFYIMIKGKVYDGEITNSYYQRSPHQKMFDQDYTKKIAISFKDESGNEKITTLTFSFGKNTTDDYNNGDIVSIYYSNQYADVCVIKDKGMFWLHVLFGALYMVGIIMPIIMLRYLPRIIKGVLTGKT